MAMTAPDDHVRYLADLEPLAVKIARVEETQKAMAENVLEIKATLHATIEQTDKRLNMLEDVRIPGLEQREIRAKAITDERARVAARGWGRWEKLGAFLVGVIVPIVAALIASGNL